jgi:hypothetical protein
MTPSPRPSWVFGLIALVLVAIVYVRYYASVAKEPQLLQTSVSNEKLLDLLEERQPLVLNESIADVQELSRTVLRYQRASESKGDVRPSAHWTLATSRYTLLYIRSQSGTVDIVHPFRPHDVYRIKLNPGQVLLLPPRYRFRCTSTTLSFLAVHDWLSLVLRPFAYTLLTFKK